MFYIIGTKNYQDKNGNKKSGQKQGNELLRLQLDLKYIHLLITLYL